MAAWKFVALAALALAVAPITAHAACTEKDQEAKVNTLSGLVANLAAKNDPRAQTISQEMQGAMTLEGDPACAAYDKMIQEAK